MDIKKLVLDDFCLRQFKKGSSCFIEFNKEEFLKKVNEVYSPNNLKEGYAPFCKHLFIENFTNSFCYYKELNSNNENLVKTIYESRTDKELPVLRRYLPKENINFTKAKFLDIILYSKEQISKEKISMKEVDINKEIDYDWGIISVKPQDLDHEIPMDPITVMRNALGIEYGGSGKDIDKNKYQDSVNFWSKNIIIK